jgi:RNA polymerase sigma factor (TIGR02999 family)
MQNLPVEKLWVMLGAEWTSTIAKRSRPEPLKQMSRPIPSADGGAMTDPVVGEDERRTLDALFPLAYEELRRIAHQRLRSTAHGQTLNTTALVHEAYLRLAERTGPSVVDRAHFCALASRAMRFVLVDYARTRTAQKRGGSETHVSLDDVQIAADERAFDLLMLDETLDQLKAHDERLAQLVEYRFFGGLSYEEIAEVTGLSVPTVKRDWRRARSWLYVHIERDQ